MEQPAWLTMLQALSALSAPAMAFFTWNLAGYTQELVKAQNMSNRVLERQAEIQESQHRLQERLAAGEARPLVSIYLSAANSKLILANLGKYGVEVEGVWMHRNPPDRPGGGEEVRFRPEVHGLVFPSPGTPVFPVGIVSGQSLALSLNEGSLPHEAQALEVRYRHGASPEVLLSDLWTVERNQTGHPVRLSRRWRARAVSAEGA